MIVVMLLRFISFSNFFIDFIGNLFDSWKSCNRFFGVFCYFLMDCCIVEVRMLLLMCCNLCFCCDIFL